jgi:hypothetical protein
LLRPEEALGSVRLTGGFFGVLAGMIRADLRASDAISENSPSVWTAPQGYYSGLRAGAQCYKD